MYSKHGLSSANFGGQKEFSIFLLTCSCNKQRATIEEYPFNVLEQRNTSQLGSSNNRKWLIILVVFLKPGYKKMCSSSLHKDGEKFDT